MSDESSPSHNTDSGPMEWFCFICAIAFGRLIEAASRVDRPNVPPRCPDCNRPMRRQSETAVS